MFSLTRNNYYLKLGCILIFLSFFASCNNIEQDLPSAPEAASKLLNKKDTSSTHKDKEDATHQIVPFGTSPSLPILVRQKNKSK